MGPTSPEEYDEYAQPSIRSDTPTIFATALVSISAAIPFVMLGLAWLTSEMVDAAVVAAVTLVIYCFISILVFAFRARIITAIRGRVVSSMSELTEPARRLTHAIVARDVDTAITEAFELGRGYFSLRGWLASRTWLVATALSFLVAFSGLAASALLYLQTKELQQQTEYLGHQTKSFQESNRNLESQIAEAKKQTDLLQSQFRQTERSRLLGILYDQVPMTPVTFSGEQSIKGGTVESTGIPAVSPQPRHNTRLRQEAAIAFIAMENDRDGFVNLRRALLQGVQLKGDLRGVDMTGAVLAFAELDETELDHLNEANLSGAKLRDAKLISAWAEESKLIGCDLYDATCDGAHMRKCDLSRADLESASFAGTDFKNANLSHSILRYADFADADLQDANFEFADLRNVRHLKEAKNVSAAKFKNAFVAPTFDMGDYGYKTIRVSVEDVKVWMDNVPNDRRENLLEPTHKLLKN